MVMTYLGLLEKLGILFNLTNKYIVIPILFGIIMVTTILNKFNLLGNKKRRINAGILKVIMMPIIIIIFVNLSIRIASEIIFVNSWNSPCWKLDISALFIYSGGNNPYCNPWLAELLLAFVILLEKELDLPFFVALVLNFDVE